MYFRFIIALLSAYILSIIQQYCGQNVNTLDLYSIQVVLLFHLPDHGPSCQMHQNQKWGPRKKQQHHIDGNRPPLQIKTVFKWFLRNQTSQKPKDTSRYSQTFRFISSPPNPFHKNIIILNSQKTLKFSPALGIRVHNHTLRIDLR